MKARRPLPSQERLRALFGYDAQGFLVSRITSGRRQAGKRVGSVTVQNGAPRYLVAVDGKLYVGARLIWKWHTGEDPEIVDHINRISTDDRIENLRASSCGLNNANRVGWSACRLKGAHRANGSYMARIYKDGRSIYIGRFKTPEAAHEAYVKAAAELFGDHACPDHKETA